MSTGALLAMVLMTGDAGVLTSIREVLVLSQAEAAQGRRVSLEGVVTYADPLGRDFFLEADGAAISMWYPDAGFLIRQGDRLALAGVTAAGDYAPKLEPDPRSIVRLASGLPIPREVPSQADLASGRIDCRSVTFDAVVREARTRGGRLELKLADLYGPTRLLFPQGVTLEAPEALVGAEVQVRATVAVDLNEKRQRIGLRLYSQAPSELVVRRAARPLQSLPVLTIGELLRFHPDGSGDPRQVVQGVVTLASGPALVLTDGTGTVRVQVASGQEVPAPGDRVTMAGFIEVARDRPRLTDAIVLQRERGPALMAKRVGAEALLDEGLDDQLVRVDGVVTSLLTAPLTLVTIEGERGAFLAMTLGPGPLPVPAAFEPGARVAVTGVKARTTDQSSPVVLLRSPADLEVLAGKPFWTLPRAVVAMVTLVVLLLAAASFIVRLRERSEALEARVAARTRELTQRTQELEALHGLRARLIATVAHDVRSPLSVIQLNTELLARELPQAERETIARDVGAAVGLVNDELTALVRRYRDEAVLLRAEPFEAREHVTRAVDRLRPALAAKQQTVTVEAPAPIRLLGDDAIFEHIVVNLLSNASKYSPAGAPITVRLDAEGTLSVIDRGVGLSARDLALLFHPTERPSNRPTAKEPSSGQGLLLCERWVKAMRGELGATSTPGAGSTFTLRLPRAG